MENTNVSVASLLRTSIGTCAFLLFLHKRTESSLVNVDALFRCHLQSQVDREAIGIVERKCCFARNHRSTRSGLCLLNCGIKNGGTCSKSSAEGVFFRICHFRNCSPILFEFRVGSLHCILRSGQQGRHRSRINTKQTHRTNGASNEAAKHIAAAVISRPDAITNQHQRRAYVISNHAKTNVIVVGRTGLGSSTAKTVMLTAHFLSGSNNGINLVNFVHIRLVLQDESQAFQTCTGIDRFLVKLTQQRVILTASLAAHVLVKNQIPQLKIAVTARVNIAPHSLGTVGRTTIVVPLAAGTCRTGLTSIPKVLFPGQTHNVTRIHSDLLSQNIECLIVLLPNGDPHAIAIEAILAVRL